MKHFIAWAKRVGEPKVTIIVGTAWMLVIIMLAVVVGLFMPDSWSDAFENVSFVVIILGVAFLVVQSRITRKRNVPVELPTEMAHEVDRLIAGGQRPEAIKYIHTNRDRPEGVAQSGRSPRRPHHRR